MSISHSAATTILAVTGTYVSVGLAFAVAFVTRGVARIDPSAAGMRWTVRLMLVPASVALWPVLLRLWILANARRAGQ